MAKKETKMIETDGKSSVPNVTDLNVQLAQDVFEYETLDPKEYAGQLDEMNSADLQRECQRLGMIPQTNRDVMVDRLKKNFDQAVSRIATPSGPRTVEPLKKRSTKKAMDVLSEATNVLR